MGGLDALRNGEITFLWDHVAAKPGKAWRCSCGRACVLLDELHFGRIGAAGDHFVIGQAGTGCGVACRVCGDVFKFGPSVIHAGHGKLGDKAKAFLEDEEEWDEEEEWED